MPRRLSGNPSKQPRNDPSRESSGRTQTANRIPGFLRIPNLHPERRFTSTVAFQTHRHGRDRDSLAFRTAGEMQAVVVRIGIVRAGCRRERFYKDIVMPPAKKPAPATNTTAAPAKPAAAKTATPAAGKKAAPVASKAAVPEGKTAAPVKKAAAPVKKAVPAKAAPQITLTLKQIAAELAEGHELSKKAAEAVLGDFVSLVTRQLVKGDKIRLTGLGILQVRDRPARTARNPATGESVQVAASKKIAFRPAKELKEAV